MFLIMSLQETGAKVSYKFVQTLYLVRSLPSEVLTMACFG